MIRQLKLAILSIAMASTSACFVYYDNTGVEYGCNLTSSTTFACAPTGRVIPPAPGPCVPLNGQGC